MALISSLGVCEMKPLPALNLDGGRGRDRTGGLLVANEALSQLSYTPIDY